MLFAARQRFCRYQPRTKLSADKCQKKNREVNPVYLHQHGGEQGRREKEFERFGQVQTLDHGTGLTRTTVTLERKPGEAGAGQQADGIPPENREAEPLINQRKESRQRSQGNPQQEQSRQYRRPIDGFRVVLACVRNDSSQGLVKSRFTQ